MFRYAVSTVILGSSLLFPAVSSAQTYFGAATFPDVDYTETTFPFDPDAGTQIEVTCSGTSSVSFSEMTVTLSPPSMAFTINSNRTNVTGTDPRFCVDNQVSFPFQVANVSVTDTGVSGQNNAATLFVDLSFNGDKTALQGPVTSTTGLNGQQIGQVLLLAATRWEIAGTLTAVDTSNGLITEFPTATVGSPFSLTLEFDSTSPVSQVFSETEPAPGLYIGNRYRYLDALISMSLSVDGVPLARAPADFDAIDIWDNFGFPGTATTSNCFDPGVACDGFVAAQNVEPTVAGGFAQIGLTMRGPDNLDIFAGPGLPVSPPPELVDLSQTTFQLVDGADFVVGDVEDVSLILPVVDSDGDGVNDDADLCPETPEGESVDADGCTPVELISVVIDDVQALIDNGETTDKAQDKLAKAQEKLNKAISELANGDGKKALEKTGDAVKELLKAGEEGADVGDLVDKLVEFARSQAQAAIDEAIAAGGDPKEIVKAQRETTMAEDELADGKPEKAIDHYAKAWDHARKA